MKQISFDPSRFQVEEKTEWWKEAGKEMSAFFGKNVYWIFWKYGRDQIDRAYAIAQKEGDRDFTHFMNRIIHG